MKRLTFFVTAMMVAGLSFGGCTFTSFGQFYTDWYPQADPVKVDGFYFTMGLPGSMVDACHPENEYVFAWEDGFFIYGTYGDTGLGQCNTIACPPILSDDPPRMVFGGVIASHKETRFVLDSVQWWRNGGVAYFNFDNSEGITHPLGTLQPLTATQEGDASDSRLVLRGEAKPIRISLPLPTQGFYGDPSIDPRSLVVGIAILGTTDTRTPQTHRTEDFRLLAAIPVDVQTLSAQKLDLEIPFPFLYKDLTNGRKPFLTYTLILEDGTDRPLEAKPFLPATAPVSALEKERVTLTPINGQENLVIKNVPVDEPAEPKPTRISYVTAYDWINTVEFTVKVQHIKDHQILQIFRSPDGILWSPVDLSQVSQSFEGNQKVYRFYDDDVAFLNRSSNGVFYKLQVVDTLRGSVVTSVKTRARRP